MESINIFEYSAWAGTALKPRCVDHNDIEYLKRIFDQSIPQQPKNSLWSHHRCETIRPKKIQYRSDFTVSFSIFLFRFIRDRAETMPWNGTAIFRLKLLGETHTRNAKWNKIFIHVHLLTATGLWFPNNFSLFSVHLHSIRFSHKLQSLVASVDGFFRSLRCLELRVPNVKHKNQLPTRNIYAKERRKQQKHRIGLDWSDDEREREINVHGTAQNNKTRKTKDKEIESSRLTQPVRFFQ